MSTYRIDGKRSYTRKTKDEYQIHVKYEGVWEHECTEHTRKAASTILNNYRTDAPQYPAKLVKKRVRIETIGE